MRALEARSSCDQVLPAKLVTDLPRGVEERGLVDRAAALTIGFLARRNQAKS